MLLFEAIKEMEDCSISMRNQFVRELYRRGKSVKEIIEMFRDLDEGNVVEIIGVKKVYGDK